MRFSGSKLSLFILIFLIARPLWSQSQNLPDAPSEVVQKTTRSASSISECNANVQLCSWNSFAPIVGSKQERASTDWQAVGRQSFMFLTVQHGMRLLQPKTRAELGGRFWSDYVDSIEGIQGWGDGDSIVTNYLMHPGMGSIADYIYIQNSPRQRTLEFDPRSSLYWKSRLKALAFSAAYSTQFEIGLYSEASIGNVGLRPGTSGLCDFVMTPVGGLAITVAEDAIDRRLSRGERNWSGRRVRLFRSIFNPTRSIANLLRTRQPWYRDDRPLRTDNQPELEAAIGE